MNPTDLLRSNIDNLKAEITRERERQRTLPAHDAEFVKSLEETWIHLTDTRYSLDRIQEEVSPVFRRLSPLIPGIISGPLPNGHSFIRLTSPSTISTASAFITEEISIPNVADLLSTIKENLHQQTARIPPDQALVETLQKMSTYAEIIAHQLNGQEIAQSMIKRSQITPPTTIEQLNTPPFLGEITDPFAIKPLIDLQSNQTNASAPPAPKKIRRRLTYDTCTVNLPIFESRTGRKGRIIAVQNCTPNEAQVSIQWTDSRKICYPMITAEPSKFYEALSE